MRKDNYCLEWELTPLDVVKLAAQSDYIICEKVAEDWLKRNRKSIFSNLMEAVAKMVKTEDWGALERIVKEDEEWAYRVNEAVFDVTWMANDLTRSGSIECEDSRDLFHEIQEIAEEFENQFDCYDPNQDYISEVYEFARKRLLEKFGKDKE